VPPRPKAWPGCTLLLADTLLRPVAVIKHTSLRLLPARTALNHRDDRSTPYSHAQRQQPTSATRQIKNRALDMGRHGTTALNHGLLFPCDPTRLVQTLDSDLWG